MKLSDNQKKWILTGVAGVGVAAVFYYLYSNGQFSQLANGVIPSGTVSDVSQPAGSGVASPLYAPGNYPGYTGYNMPPIIPAPSPGTGDTAAAGDGCCCSKGNPQSSCFSGSPLDTGGTQSSVNAFLNYLQNTNPEYVKLIGEQNQQYSALFVSGSAYSSAPSFAGITG